MREKRKLSSEEDLYWKQYDRFVSQLREEVKELYWLYNFFFIFDSALLFFFFKGDIKNALSWMVVAAGILISVIWFWVFYKQIGWRNEWINKIKKLDEYLEDEYRMWSDEKKESKLKKIKRLITGKERIAWVMLSLPVFFFLFWILSTSL